MPTAAGTRAGNEEILRTPNRAMTPCPTCGRPRLKGAVLDHEHNRLLADGRLIHLTPREADLMFVLTRDPAFTFTAPELADAIWGPRWPVCIHTSLGAIVAGLRRKLAPTSLRIVAVRRRGYGLRQELGGRPPPRTAGGPAETTP